MFLAARNIHPLELWASVVSFSSFLQVPGLSITCFGVWFMLYQLAAGFSLQLLSLSVCLEFVTWSFTLGVLLLEGDLGRWWSSAFVSFGGGSSASEGTFKGTVNTVSSFSHNNVVPTRMTRINISFCVGERNMDTNIVKKSVKFCRKCAKWTKNHVYSLTCWPNMQFTVHLRCFCLLYNF